MADKPVTAGVGSRSLMNVGWRRKKSGAGSPPAAVPISVQLDTDELERLSAVFSAPRWLRDLGVAAWFLVGVGFLLFSLIWLLGATSEITMPVIAAFIVASVSSPIVAWLHRHRVPRALGAVVVLLGLIAIAIAVLVLVLGGIASETDGIGAYASEAADKVQSWLEDAGVDTSTASSANSQTQGAVPQMLGTLLTGVVDGIKGLTSLAFGLSFAALSLFFLLKDGPYMRDWVNRHVGLPLPVAQTITRDVIVSLRGYFGGVTIVAAFNAVIVGLGAVVLGVPLAGTIAVVSFVTAYVPYIGAFIAGAFAVIVALGATDPQTALAMLIIVLLANGLLQNILQPIAFGATLNLNPLVVLIVTIGAGCLFGMIGLVLAAPLVSAGVHIINDLNAAKAAAEAEVAADTAEPEPAPG